MADDDKTRFGDKILVPNERVVQRGQGCWNCINGETASAFWTEQRKGKLLMLRQLIEQSGQGHAIKHDLVHGVVVDWSIVKMTPAMDKVKSEIDTIDHSVAARALLRCTKGVTAFGAPVGDLVAHNYLCSKWTGRDGASVAREGGKLDALPEELIDKLDGSQAIDDLVNKKLIAEDEEN